jgi:GNAT superfamily N-acetyltransferase
VTVQEAPTTLAPRLSTRPARNADAPMLRDLYLGATSETPVDALEPHQRTLILMGAQQREAELDRRYPDLARLTVTVDAVPVGRLMLSSAGSHIRLVDLSLLPNVRGQGIGSHLVGELLSEAAVAGYTMHAATAKDSRAVRFLERLGFTPEFDRGDTWDMVVLPR